MSSALSHPAVTTAAAVPFPALRRHLELGLADIMVWLLRFLVWV